tara:strand:- start:1702 stop:3405 length:1704 start_codon:yes stop_codon:yes gene_type:complete
MKIFLAQINPIVGDLRGNANKILKIASQAHQNSSDLVITPELSLWGYPPKDLLFKNNLIIEQNLILDELSKFTAKNFGDLGIMIGIAEKIDDPFFPNLFNSIALLEKGKWSIIARKMILPTYEVFDEKRYFRSENKVSILNKKLKNKTWKIGITICEDLWVNHDIEGRGKHKQNPIIDLEKKGIDFLLNLSASPYTFKKLENRIKISSNASKYLKIPIIYLNQVGGNDDLIFDGNSFILNSGGSKSKQLKSFKEDCYCWNISDKKSNLVDERHISKFETIFDALVLGVQDYAKKCGFKTALIGLSGGIDSALVSVIATAAFGNKNVFTIAMPSKWNSINSKNDAEALAKNLNINFNVLPIHDIINSFEKNFQKFLNVKIDGIANENMQSRTRGALLMALANQNNHLLLSTGNKSELAVGYCTLYGDMNGGLAVIGDLYKTNIYNICNWLDSESSLEARINYKLPTKNKIIGDKIIKKPPSAELGPNQLDSDSIPPYEELDEILKNIIEEKEDINQLLARGYAKNIIIKIIKLIKKAEFKRKQAPPILKLSNQSLGNDWRIPIAISKE